MRTLLLAISLPAVAVVSYLCFQAVPSSEPSQDDFKTSGSPPTTSPSKTDITLKKKKPLGQVYQDAWDEIPSRKLSYYERRNLQKALLKEWAEVDLKAALDALLAESWGGQASQNEASFFLESLREQFKNQSAAVNLWLAEGHFGLLEERQIKGMLFEVLGENPDELTALLPELDNADFLEALKVLGRRSTEERIDEIWTQLKERSLGANAFQLEGDQNDPFRPSNSILSELAKKLSQEELLASYDQGGEDFRRMITQILTKKLSGSEAFEFAESIPQHSRNEFILQEIHRNRSISNFQQGIEALIKNEAWEVISDKQLSSQLTRISERQDAAELAGWVANLPQREEVTEIFHRGVERYLRENPDEGWNWLSEFESGTWRDRGFAELSQQALYSIEDPELSRRALEQIEDPALKEVAEGWRAKWESNQE